MNTLEQAVAQGIITPYAAFCGLDQDDVLALQRRAPETEVLVRYRGAFGDSREVMPIRLFPVGDGTNPNHNLLNVRDVLSPNPFRLRSQDLHPERA